ncbi:MAG: YwaF family protein [Clostridia bacterium]|nr:YwaF family protein [Clostridia bacterium]
MNFLIFILKTLDLQMTKPEMFGAFHILWLFITLAFTVFFCLLSKKKNEKTTHRVVFYTAILVTVLEIYKQINYTFTAENGSIISDFQWYAFPFQFCSMPMYIGLLYGIIRNERIKNSLLAFLATYGLFAGICVMLYPSTVFIGTIGINIQTMICHGSMVAVGVYLLYSRSVLLHHKTILRAMPVFAIAVGVAAVMNEIAHFSGLLERETFNMFFISPHCEPSLPVYSAVQGVVPFPFCLILYIAGFSGASYLILLIAMLINKISAHFRASEKVKTPV